MDYSKSLDVGKKLDKEPAPPPMNPPPENEEQTKLDKMTDEEELEDEEEQTDKEYFDYGSKAYDSDEPEEDKFDDKYDSEFKSIVEEINQDIEEESPSEVSADSDSPKITDSQVSAADVSSKRVDSKPSYSPAVSTGAETPKVSTETSEVVAETSGAEPKGSSETESDVNDIINGNGSSQDAPSKAPIWAIAIGVVIIVAAVLLVWKFVIPHGVDVVPDSAIPELPVLPDSVTETADDPSSEESDSTAEEPDPFDSDSEEDQPKDADDALANLVDQLKD